MYQKILVPMALDHDVSPETLNIAKALAGPDAVITALHVHEAPQGSAKAYMDKKMQRDALAVAQAELAAKTDHLEGVLVELVVGHTYRSIIDYAGQHDIDCIVMGSHKPEFSDYLLGSTAARVVRHAPCAVHVYRS